MKLEVLMFNAGIGGAKLALTQIGVNFEIVGISEHDINALQIYHKLHHTQAKALETPPVTTRDKIKHLSQFIFTKNGKIVDVRTMNDHDIDKLYTAHIETNNLGHMKDITKIPKCDVIVFQYIHSDLDEMKRILQNNDTPPLIITVNIPTVPKRDLTSWCKNLNTMGYESDTYTIKAVDCGIPQNRTRDYIISSTTNRKIVIENKGTPVLNDLLGVVDSTNYIYIPCENVSPDSKLVKVSNGPVVPAYHLKGICPTLTTTGPNSKIKVITDDGRVRYLTQKEQWMLMGFDEKDFDMVKHLNPVKYAIKSSVINVLTEIFIQLYVTPIVTLQNYITVPSYILGDNLHNNLLKNLKDTMCETYVKNHGYITEVISLDKIHRAYISYADSSNKFYIKYSIRTIKPLINNIYMGIVKGVCEIGVYVNMSKIKKCDVLVMKCPCHIRDNEDIKFKLTETHFDMKEKTYSAIGTHICKE